MAGEYGRVCSMTFKALKIVQPDLPASREIVCKFLASTAEECKERLLMKLALIMDAVCKSVLAKTDVQGDTIAVFFFMGALLKITSLKQRPLLAVSSSGGENNV